MKTYEEIRETLKTGDVILFSGRGPLSHLIQHFTKSIYSHVGLVVKSDLGVFLLESTTLSNVADFETGELREGVQLVLLSQRLEAYRGLFAVRRLDKSIGPSGAVNLKAFRHEVRGRKYEQSRYELIMSAVDCVDDQDEDLSSLFCSELVAEALQRAEAIPCGISSNEYTPADFAMGLHRYFRPVEVFTWQK